jgi:two-component system chemotaxis response regulator CheB
MAMRALGKAVPQPASSPIRVAIVDDSTVARAMMSWTLEKAGMTVVATANNGKDAISALAGADVEVLVLDLEMPQMDGLSALPEILSASPAAVLVVSSLTTEGARATIEALRLGAADTLAKPAAMLGGNTARDFSAMLIDKIRMLKRDRHPMPEGVRVMRGLPTPASFSVPARPQVVAIAASTGGPTAMFGLFDDLDPLADVPIIVTQHLPAPFVPVMAEHLSRHARRPAVVAENGLPLQPGRIHIAPGDAHVRLETRAGRVVLLLDQTPVSNGCRPSADPMFEAVAEQFGPGALAVVLSGMGRDGSEGARLVRERGGTVIAQDMQSSVVWGMPGVVCKQGTAHVSCSPTGIAALINAAGALAR